MTHADLEQEKAGDEEPQRKKRQERKKPVASPAEKVQQRIILHEGIGNGHGAEQKELVTVDI